MTVPLPVEVEQRVREPLPGPDLAEGVVDEPEVASADQPLVPQVVHARVHVVLVGQLRELGPALHGAVVRPARVRLVVRRRCRDLMEILVQYVLNTRHHVLVPSVEATDLRIHSRQ